MLQAYASNGSAFDLSSLGDSDTLPQSVVWLDLLSPTPEEERRTEELLGVELPTHEDLKDIEPSSRLYVENDTVYLTASLAWRIETGFAEITDVGFVIIGEPAGHDPLRGAEGVQDLPCGGATHGGLRRHRARRPDEAPGDDHRPDGGDPGTHLGRHRPAVRQDLPARCRQEERARRLEEPGVADRRHRRVPAADRQDARKPDVAGARAQLSFSHAGDRQGQGDEGALQERRRGTSSRSRSTRTSYRRTSRSISTRRSA